MRHTKIDSNIDFGIFYDSYFKRFVRYAYYYLNNWETAKDITHDSILYYWENKNKISSDSDILGYILLTVKNKCLNYLKHLQVESLYSEKQLKLHEWEVQARIMTLEDSSYSELFTQEITEILTESLAKLPKQTQDIFIENRFKNKSRKEIAVKLGVSIQKVDYHINKANKHLYKELKDYIPLFPILLIIIS